MQVLSLPCSITVRIWLTFLLAMSRMMDVKISTIREELTEQCSAILYSYRRNCAAATVPTQVRRLVRRMKHGYIDNFAS